MIKERGKVHFGLFQSVWKWAQKEDLTAIDVLKLCSKKERFDCHDIGFLPTIKRNQRSNREGNEPNSYSYLV